MARRILAASSLVSTFTCLVAATAGGQAVPGGVPPSVLRLPQPQQQQQAPAATTAEATLAEALMANPATAPYRYTLLTRGGKVVIQGRVGSKAIHDVAIRTAIGLGLPVGDEIVIDSTTVPAAAPGGIGPYPAARPSAILTSYTYPPPLFGRYDEPFFGMEPPLLTYPAWWGPLSQGRLAQMPQPPTVSAEAGGQLPARTVEMTIDPTGAAVIRGAVPTEAEKMEVGQRLAQTAGVSRIINQLTVVPGSPSALATASKPADDQPPPPPTPSMVQPRAEPAEPKGRPIRPADPTSGPAQPRPAANASPVQSRAERAIQAVPDLAGQTIKVSVRDGLAQISGTVPTVYEAMLAFRAVQQTPGVAEIVDRLQFVVPDGSARNPLLGKGSPEDVEPYLAAQVRRQVGDSAHLDRLRLQGDDLQVVGTLERPEDRARVEAVLRSMPVLRGFKIVPEFRVLDR